MQKIIERIKKLRAREDKPATRHAEAENHFGTWEDYCDALLRAAGGVEVGELSSACDALDEAHDALISMGQRPSEKSAPIEIRDALRYEMLDAPFQHGEKQ